MRGGNGNLVRSCDVYGTGEGAIAIGGGDRPTLVPCGNAAENNDVHDYCRWARTYRPGVLVEGLSNAPKHRRLHRALWTAAGAAAIYGGYLLAGDESGSSGVYRTIDVATGREATVTGFRSFKQAAGSGLMLVGTVSILITWDLF